MTTANVSIITKNEKIKAKKVILMASKVITRPNTMTMNLDIIAPPPITAPIPKIKIAARAIMLSPQI